MTTPRARHRGHRRARGQSLVIFALCSLVIFATVGLAIDAGVSYLSGNRVERAAAAAALAGVPYMPDQFATAQVVGIEAAKRSGFVPSSNVQVNIYRVPQGCDSGGSTIGCAPNRIGASVFVKTQTSFLTLLGFPSVHTVGQKATAEYLQTLTLGQPGAQLGGTAAQLNASPPQVPYILRTEAWASDRSNGDAYTPNPASPGGGCCASAAPTDRHTLNSQVGNEVTDLTLTSGGFNPVPALGGYSFQVIIPESQVGGANVMVYNPAFSVNANGGGPCNGGMTVFPGCANAYHEWDSLPDVTNGAYYSVMEYTLYKVLNPFDHTQDIPLSQIKVDPINATTATVANWKDGRTGATLNAGTAASLYQTWVDVSNPASLGPTSPGNLVSFTKSTYAGKLSAGTYRLRVDTLDQNGLNPDPTSVAWQNNTGITTMAHKGYAVQAVTAEDPTNPTPCTPKCSVGALNELAVYTPIVSGAGSSQFDIPMVYVPPAYAGQTLDFYAFDPGDISQPSNLLSIANPDTGNPATFQPGSTYVHIYNLGHSRGTPPSAANEILPGTQARPGAGQNDATIQTILPGGCAAPPNCFNGNWLLYKVQVPSDYKGAPGATLANLSVTPASDNGYWSLRYVVNGAGSANDTMTMGVNFDGPPVHLVPNS